MVLSVHTFCSLAHSQFDLTDQEIHICNPDQVPMSMLLWLFLLWFSCFVFSVPSAYVTKSCPWSLSKIQFFAVFLLKLLSEVRQPRLTWKVLLLFLHVLESLGYWDSFLRLLILLLLKTTKDALPENLIF